MKRSTLILLSVFISILTLSGCSNTFKGAGRDMESAGEWMQDTF